jgi:hypothetical protein
MHPIERTETEIDYQKHADALAAAGDEFDGDGEAMAGK